MSKIVCQIKFCKSNYKKLSNCFQYHRVAGGLGCVGKKTALLQAEASACVSRLANVQFCGSAVRYFVFLFLSLSSKLSVVSCLFTLVHNVSALRCRTVDCQSEATTVKPIRLAAEAGNGQ